MITTRQNEPDKPSVHQYAVDYPCLAVDLAAANPRRNSLAEELREAARSRNTRIAYTKAWQRFTSHCHARGIHPQEARSQDITKFFIHLGTEPAESTGRPLAMGTLKMYRSALNRHYAEIGRESPAAGREISDVLAGLARVRDEVPRRVKALREYEIKAMLDTCPGGRFGRRDGAMLALGFAAALRRSELCALLVADIDILRCDRMVVWIRRSKTDQAGKGQRVAVPEGRTIRPVSQVRDWLEVAAIHDGYLFQTFRRGGRPSGRPLHHSEVPRLVKKYAVRVGLDPASYSGHSLRAGFVTSAAAHRARLDKIMEVTRHKNPATVMQYIRDADAFEQHAGVDFL
ncbi:tyrosine-type recombinase/integrase [Candidatus Palauibacter sp.]|uniref:tyrosine-type recombinase/integrase n=1 Tax=Candidatus Palauibacter sp. TaxID=3101350 RepID=UPI003CC53E19